MAQVTEDSQAEAISPPFYVVEPSSTHTHSVILLHGLGSNGEKFGTELLSTAVLSDGRHLASILPGARFIFPTAKRRRSSAFGRSRLNQWFDIASLDDPSYRRHIQVRGLEESMGDVFSILEQEKNKVSASNILLGGLSQGSAMGIICLLAMEFPIGGFVGMSTWMPYREDFEDLLEKDDEDDDEDNPFESYSDAEKQTNGQDPILRVTAFLRDLLSRSNRSSLSTAHTAITTPIFLGHGSADEKIPPLLGEEACETLRGIGFAVEWETYEGHGHWYKIPEEIDDLFNFVRDKMGWELQDATTTQR